MLENPIVEKDRRNILNKFESFRTEVRELKKNRKENPVVIIDDITSYFDEDRRKSILEFFNKRDIQVLISSTDKLDIEAKNFYVEKGIIEDENNVNK